MLGEPFKASDFIHPLRFINRLHYKMFGGTHLVNRAGLARTFQNIRLFKEMSVVENLLVAQHMGINRSLLAGVLNNMGMVMDISDHIVVLDHGEVIAAGPPQAIRDNPVVIAAYLGAEEEALA